MAKKFVKENFVIPGPTAGQGMDFFPYSLQSFTSGYWPYGYMGNASGVNPYSTAAQYNNLSGYYKQVYLTNWQLKQVREQARNIYAYNEFAQAVITIFQDFCVGEGFKYKVTPTKDGVNSKLVSLAQELVDLCVEKNNFQQMELEYIYRIVVEGEACCRIFENSDGLLDLSWVENDLILPPSDTNDPDMSFGIACRKDDLHDVVGYWICDKLSDTGVSYLPSLVPADDINYDKAGTYSNSKRGISLFFPVYQNFMNAEQILNSMVSLAISRSKVSMIRKIDNAPPEGIDALLAKTTNVTVTNPAPGQQPLNIETLPNSSILTSSANVEYEFPQQNLDSAEAEITLLVNLRAIAANFGISEAHLTQKLESSAYASHLVAESPSYRTFSLYQKRVGDFFASKRTKPHQSLLWKQITTAVKKGLLPTNALSDLKIVPTGPSLITREPYEEAQTNKIYWDMGIKSSNTIAAEQGMEYDEQKKQSQNDDGLENILKSVAAIKAVGVTPEAGKKLMKQYHPVLPDDIINELFTEPVEDNAEQQIPEKKPAEKKSVKTRSIKPK